MCENEERRRGNGGLLNPTHVPPWSRSKELYHSKSVAIGLNN